MLISVCYHVINVQVTMLLMSNYFAFILLQYSPMAIPDEVFERYFRGWNPWDYPSSPLWLWTPPKIWSSWDFDLRAHGQFAATRICVFVTVTQSYTLRYFIQDTYDDRHWLPIFANGQTASKMSTSSINMIHLLTTSWWWWWMYLVI